ncbi:MAG TPA: DNA methyltransferase [Tepidisphaeraceae bacterium]|jgi:site-specific DNA-methyltransferase (adenine-specific)|nr:DNA methyltransferase [Tepidisphaeraceae bacterium]
MNSRKRAFTTGLEKLGGKKNGQSNYASTPARPTPALARDGTLQADHLICGDSIHVLNDAPPGWVDLVFADPPFNIGYLYDGYNDQRNAEDYLHFSRDWMQAIHRALKPAGSFFLAIGDDFAADLCVIARRELGFNLRNWIIWHYTFGQQPRVKFAKSHTHILYFTKDAKQFTFNADAVRIPSARQTTYADPRANPKGKLPDDVWFLRPQEAPEPFFSPESDTWNVSRVCGTFKEREGWHGCQMPMGVLNRIIAAASNPGDLVLDPFNGSGTTTVAATLAGRRFIGIEQSQKYVEFARLRHENARANLAASQVDSSISLPNLHDVNRSSRVLTPTDALGRLRVTRPRSRKIA